MYGVSSPLSKEYPVVLTFHLVLFMHYLELICTVLVLIGAHKLSNSNPSQIDFMGGTSIFSLTK